ncbi:hypothetical protein [Actinacidiphila glaucinigra]|uniref:hypothetical protein n=1 Tax=Actinacidiphila glaucinigra TaxID=235986 RepID=UPI0035E2D7AF
MHIPMRLIELQRAVNAADARYHSGTNANAIVALTHWSDASAELTRSLIAHAADSGIPHQMLEAAVRRAAYEADHDPEPAQRRDSLESGLDVVQSALPPDPSSPPRTTGQGFTSLHGRLRKRVDPMNRSRQ